MLVILWDSLRPRTRGLTLNRQRGQTFEMWFLLLMSALWGTSLAQTKESSTVATVAPPIEAATGGLNNATITRRRRHGADYHPMEGGTELKVPFPQAVPIKQAGELTSGDPEYPCFGTFRGNSSRFKRILLTSVYCDVEGHIDKMYTDTGIEDIEIKKLIGPLRKKRQAVVALTHPFTVVSYEFPYTKRLNEETFGNPGELISDEKEYLNIIGNPKSVGIVLASRPYKAGAVSLNQSNCSDIVYRVRRLPEFPENLTDGVFCIFMSDTSVKYNGVDIKPGLPCRDSLGSPVLVDGPSGYNRVLGIVIMYMCQWLPPEWGDIPRMAVATSTAYAFNYTRLPPPRTFRPYPFASWPTMGTPFLTSRRTHRPRSESASATFSTTLYPFAVMIVNLLQNL